MRAIFVIGVLIVIFIISVCGVSTREGICPPYRHKCDVRVGTAKKGTIHVDMNRGGGLFCHPIRRDHYCTKAAKRYGLMPTDYSVNKFNIRCHQAGAHPCFVCTCNRNACIHQSGGCPSNNED